MAGSFPAERIPELVQLICQWAAERDEVLTPIRLVKLLYLADLYYARKAGGKTLTGWPWKFVHFGPYCAESLNAIDKAVALGLIEKQAYESKHTREERFIYRGRRPKSEPPAERLLDSVSMAVTSGLKAAVRKWADDTPGLLTHVYFETEPMQHIEPGDTLDFRKAQPPQKVVRVPAMKLSAKKMKEAREALASLRRRTLDESPRTLVDTGPHDEAFLQAMAYEDVSESSPEFSGVVTFGDLRQPDLED